MIPRFVNRKSDHKIKNTGIRSINRASIEIPINRACQNHYLDSCRVLRIIIPKVVAQATCCKKNILNK